MMRAGLIEKMGAHWIFPSVHVAVQHCIRHRLRAGKLRTSDSAAAQNGGRSPCASPPLAPAKTAPAEVAEVQLAAVKNGDNH